MTLNFEFSCLYLLTTRMAGVDHYARLMRCWGWNPGGETQGFVHAHWTGILIYWATSLALEHMFKNNSENSGFLLSIKHPGPGMVVPLGQSGVFLAPSAPGPSCLGCSVGHVHRCPSSCYFNQFLGIVFGCKEVNDPGYASKLRPYRP